jgi:CMP-N,N'-diacetyllegionaminic acid synthase
MLIMGDYTMLAIIPARGGSKGVYRKNIRMLGGKPLVQWTIEAALKAKSIDRIIISTDDEEIADVCRNIGVEILFMRPKELAQDHSLAIDNYIYTMDRMINEFGYVYDEFAVLLPTAPFRTAADIDAAVVIFENSVADSVISCKELEHPLSWVCDVNDSGKILQNKRATTKNIMNRQQAKVSYIPNGAIYVLKNSLIKSNYSYYTENTYAYLMPSERSIDIDTELDLEFAEFYTSRSKASA